MVMKLLLLLIIAAVSYHGLDGNDTVMLIIVTLTAQKPVIAIFAIKGYGMD